MSNKTLIMHVGLPKCGSSSLQNFLSTNRENLASVGICYPKTTILRTLPDNTSIELGHEGLLKSIHSFDKIKILDNDYKSIKATEQLQPWITLKEDFLSSDFQCFIVGHESFIGNPRNVKMKLIEDIFDNIPIHYVIFFRRYDRWIESFFRTHVVGKQRYRDSFQSYLQEPYIRNHSLKQRLQALKHVPRRRIHLVPIETCKTSLDLFQKLIEPLNIVDTNYQELKVTDNSNQSSTLTTLIITYAMNLANLSEEERKILRQSMRVYKNRSSLSERKTLSGAIYLMKPQERKKWLEKYNNDCRDLGMSNCVVPLEITQMPEPFYFHEESTLLETVLEDIRPFWSASQTEFERIRKSILDQKVTLASYFR